MCGIVGYIGKREAKDLLIEGLHRLEYRGYDSAGIALVGGKKVKRVRALGKVAELEKKTVSLVSAATLGIAHTRWATHGKPSEKNAHPHGDCAGGIALVHNGIIENYVALKEQLVKRGHRFASETDTEVVAHLIEEHLKKNNFEEAFAAAIKELRGTYGIAAVSVTEPEKLFVARMGSPLLIGVGNEEYFVASDVSAILAHTKRVVYLEDGERAVLSRDGYVVKSGKTVQKKTISDVEWSEKEAKRGGYPHFMLKEIFDQPESFADALRGRLVPEEGTARLGGLREVAKRLEGINRLVIVSCGTSYHAGLVGEYMLEEYAGIPVEVEYASEFRYRKPLLDKYTAVLVLSQSGETADTLAALREAKNKGALTLGIVNVVGSTIARETDAGVYNHAGPEVSVASTKAFTSQLAILSLLTLYLGRKRGMSLVTGQRIAKELLKLPRLMEHIFAQSGVIKKLAKKYAHRKNYLYLGRKYNFPIAFEGALKVKEIAYVSAQGYPTGEMKHGPIALVDKESLTILIAPVDSVYEKSVSGLEEIRARGGTVLCITTEGNIALTKKSDAVITLPKTLEMLTPILAVIPLQLFAYHMSVAKGYEVDRPRNLAKSVTVE
ncbi:MAG: glutamine--fructose-6-phosphate transaminase (isomerizing) [Candidatus Moranbacteria bacterium]|jgi:glucosamine--fructose-6-phosphate aminotransferase (isomerizing)|nr:glutamine--fructose-6-phosphate transaminase (isomerizing) [Candidatus Moranbacteria bacterium]